MADYYPLLAKAITGLKDSTPEARTAIYDRARKALLGQLRAMQPPAPEAAIDREAKALEEAIARLELERAAAAAVEPPPALEPEAKPEAESRPETESEPAASSLKDEAEPTPEGSEAGAEKAPPAPPPVYGGEDEDKAAAEEAAVREALRPAAPKPRPIQAGGLRRFGIIAGALTVVVALVAFAAWKLRDRPEDLAKLSAPAPEATDQKSGGKIGQRVGEDNGATPRPAPVSPPPGATTNVPIAYRAAILLQAPAEPGGVKTYIGTVVWRRDATNRGPNQQLSTAIRADLEIPEAGFKTSLTIEKNYDAALSASHTITIRFEPNGDSAVGNVQMINVPEMRREDAPKGVPLQGMQVDIAPNVFLVGLYSSAEAQNVELIKTLNWIDIPMSLANGKIAKLTFEKGAAGGQIINDVFNEWKGQP